MHLIKLLALVATVSVLSASCHNSPDAPTALDNSSLQEANNAAAVINMDGGSCNMIGADVNGSMVVDVDSGEVNRKLENQKWVSLDCKGNEVTNLTDRAQSFRGFMCLIVPPGGGLGVLTTDSHATVAANGQATLSCKYKK